MFKTNMGGVDRGLRIAIGILLIISAAVGAFGSWAYVGVVPIITGLVGNCPAYSIFGIKTCKS